MKIFIQLFILISFFVQCQNNNRPQTVKDLEKTSDSEIIWKKDNLTGVTIFNLGKGFSDESKKIMNKKIDSIYSELIATKTYSPNSSDYKFEISFINKNFISFKSITFNKGLNKFESANSYNYDLLTGKEYDFNELYPKAIIPIILKDEFEKRGAKFDNEYIKSLEENYKRTYYFWLVGKNEIIVIIPFSNIFDEKDKTLKIPFKNLKKYKNHNLF